MAIECYFCRGIVLPHERDHLLLSDHGSHQVAMHRRCAAGHDAIAEPKGPDERVAVTCPECGAVETL
jgi:hypothetical protein